jgi:hypothetical protein
MDQARGEQARFGPLFLEEDMLRNVGSLVGFRVEKQGKWIGNIEDGAIGLKDAKVTAFRIRRPSGNQGEQAWISVESLAGIDSDRKSLQVHSLASPPHDLKGGAHISFSEVKGIAVHTLDGVAGTLQRAMVEDQDMTVTALAVSMEGNLGAHALIPPCYFLKQGGDAGEFVVDLPFSEVAKAPKLFA